MMNHTGRIAVVISLICTALLAWDEIPRPQPPGDISTGYNTNAWYNSCTVFASQPRLIDLYQQGNPPVAGTKSIFTCPSTTKTPYAPTPDHPFFMYGFNDRLDPNGAAQFKRTQVPRPVETITFTENNETNYPSSSGLYTPARHSKKANLAFVDGHAAPVYEKIFRRNAAQDNSSVYEWTYCSNVFWYPFKGAAK